MSDIPTNKGQKTAHFYSYPLHTTFVPLGATMMMTMGGERQRGPSKRGLSLLLLALKIAVICLTVEIGALAKRTQQQRKVRGSSARAPQVPASVAFRSILSNAAVATPEKENHVQHEQQQQHERKLNGSNGGNQGFVRFFDQVWLDVAATTAHTESTVTKCRYPGTNDIIDLTFGVPVRADAESSFKAKKGKTYSTSSSDSSADAFVDSNTNTPATTTTTTSTTTSNTTASFYADSNDVEAEGDFIASGKSGKKAKKTRSGFKTKYKSFSTADASVDANDSGSIDSADQVDERIPMCVILESETTSAAANSKSSKSDTGTGSTKTDDTTSSATTPTTTTPTLTTPTTTEPTMSAAEASRCYSIAGGHGDMEGAGTQESSITVTVFSDSALSLEQRGKIWQVFQQYIGPTAAGCTLDMQSVLPAASARRQLMLRHERGGAAAGRHRLQHGRNLQDASEIRLMNFGPPTVLSTGVGGK